MYTCRRSSRQVHETARYLRARLPNDEENTVRPCATRAVPKKGGFANRDVSTKIKTSFRGQLKVNPLAHTHSQTHRFRVCLRRKTPDEWRNN